MRITRLYTGDDGESHFEDIELDLPGESLLAEDTTGRGHKSIAVDGQPRRCLFIALEEGAS